nr:Uncharacterised protein [Streptococcus thermophilus]
MKMTLDQLLDLERQGWDSLCEQRGGTFYGELMTDDAVMVLVNGMVMDQPTIAASMNDAPPWDSYEITDPQLITLNDGAATLLYRATARRGSDNFEALMTSTYVLLDGQVRMKLYQQTTVTH